MVKNPDSVYRPNTRKGSYIRGVGKKFVHWRYNFPMTKDIEMIFGSLII